MTTRYLVAAAACLVTAVLLFLVLRQHKAISSAVRNPQFRPEQQAAFATLRWMLHLTVVYWVLFLAVRLAGPDVLALPVDGLETVIIVIMVISCVGLGVLAPLWTTRHWDGGSLPHTVAVRSLYGALLLAFMTVKLIDLGAGIAIIVLPVTANVLKRIAAENMFDALVERPIGIGMDQDGLAASVVDPAAADGTFRINM